MLFTALYIAALQHKYMHTKTEPTNTKCRIIYCRVKDKYTQQTKQKKKLEKSFKIKISEMSFAP